MNEQAKGVIHSVAGGSSGGGVVQIRPQEKGNLEEST